eukprot:728369-Hanusia_phi.AAC.4
MLGKDRRKRRKRRETLIGNSEWGRRIQKARTRTSKNHHVDLSRFLPPSTLLEHVSLLRSPPLPGLCCSLRSSPSSLLHSLPKILHVRKLRAGFLRHRSSDLLPSPPTLTEEAWLSHISRLAPEH